MKRSLLPPGRAWTAAPGTFLYQLLLGTSDELSRVSDRAANLVEESDPRTAFELLPDYERVLKLALSGTTALRRIAATELLTRRLRVRPIDYRNTLSAVLGLSPSDVQVIERSRAVAATFDERMIFEFYIYRNPALPGTYDVDLAQEIVNRIQHSHTRGMVVLSTHFLCDDEPLSLCDRDLLGV